MSVLSVLLAIAQGNVSPPSGLAGWLPYIGGILVAYVALRKMPGDNAQSVGATLGGLNDRLKTEVDRLDTVIVSLRAELLAEEEAHELTRQALERMREERDELLDDLGRETA